MNTKDQAKAIIEELPDDIVSDLLSLMKRLQEWSVTLELIEDKEFVKEWEKGKLEVERGETISWRKVKRTDV